MDPYRQKILDHYRHPRNFGPLAGATHRAVRLNPLCGDEVTLELNVRRGRVRAVGFQGRGCAISMAATSLLTVAADGKSVAAIGRLTPAAVLTLLGVPISPARHQCALLSFQALQAAFGLEAAEA